MKQKITILGTLLGLGAMAQGAALYSTDFTAAQGYSTGSIVGQSGWLQTSTGTITNPPAVTVTDTPDPVVSTVSLGTSGTDVNHLYDGGATVSSGNSIFVTTAVTFTAAQANGDYFLHLGNGDGSNFFARVYAKSSGAGFVLGFVSSSGTPAAAAYSSTELSFGTAYTLLLRYDYIAGVLNDTGALFVNPTTTNGSGDTPYIGLTTLGNDPTITFSSVNLRQGAAGNAPTVVIDSLSVATEAIPEPSAALLGALGALGLLRRRR
jgi:MYXO-CTERM domain-containing protein